MKKQYTAPTAYVVVLESQDVLTASYGWGDKPSDIGNADSL